MRKTLISTTPPEPVTLAEAKAFARIDCNDDDMLITSLITQAREFAENYTQRKYIAQAWEMTLDASEISNCIQLEHFDVSAVTSIKVYDEDDAESTIPTPSEYKVFNNRILFELGSYTYRDLDAMVIAYTIAGTTPEQVKLAILQIIATLYEFRESDLAGSIISLVPAGTLANLGAHMIYTM